MCTLLLVWFICPPRNAADPCDSECESLCASSPSLTFSPSAHHFSLCLILRDSFWIISTQMTSSTFLIQHNFRKHPPVLAAKSTKYFPQAPTIHFHELFTVNIVADHDIRWKGAFVIFYFVHVHDSTVFLQKTNMINWKILTISFKTTTTLNVWFCHLSCNLYQSVKCVLHLSPAKAFGHW